MSNQSKLVINTQNGIILMFIQGVRKWNVFFEKVAVAKLSNILTRTDAFKIANIITFDIQT